MVNKSKNKGTSWESEIVRYLISRGVVHAERRALKGKLDRGDVSGLIGVVIEAKNTRSISLGVFMNEVRVETMNAAVKIGVAWIKRKGFTSAASGYVVMDGETFVTLLTEAGYIEAPEVAA